MMQTASQIMQANKARKKLLQQKQIMQSLQKANKSRQKRGLDDYISPLEWTCSSYFQYNQEIKTILQNNSLTIRDIVHMLPQFHRLTFWECEWNFSNIREIIENVVDKYLGGYTINKVENGIDIVGLNADDYNKKCNVHYKQRELLIKFIDCIGDIIKTYKSRKIFAQDNAEMIYNHKIYSKLTNPKIEQLCDWDGVSEALEMIENRIESKQRYIESKKLFN